MAASRPTPRRRTAPKAASTPVRAPRPTRALRPTRTLPPPGPPAAGTLSLPYDYVQATRGWPVNLLFLAPFVLIYEGALVATRCPVENAAAAWLRSLLLGLGNTGLLVASLVLGLGFLAIVVLRARQAPGERHIYGGMLLEGVVYGLLLGGGAQLVAHALPMGKVVPLAAASGGTLDHLTCQVRDLGLAVGAGVFEELVFRGLLLGGIYVSLRHGLTADRWSSGVIALLLSSWLFSAYHHWGAFGEPYHAAVFTFRFSAGLILGALFLGRGLGIAALAHGVYDVLVML